jgi:hypothetical protein
VATKKRRRYSKGASRKVAKVMRERKRGTLRSGRSKKKVRSRKQAIAIGLSEARRRGERVPPPKKKKTKKKRKKARKTTRKTTRRKKK